MKNEYFTGVNIVRWITRILSAISIVFFLYMFVGETFFGAEAAQSKPISAFDTLHLVLMGIGIAGLLMAWKWEFWGGIISIIGFLPVMILHPGNLLSLLVVYPISGMIFVLLWWLSHKPVEIT